VIDKPNSDVALICNPRAGGRWRVLSDVLDSDEANGIRRIVTDDIDHVREALASLGQRVGLLCIYGGDGTIYRVINELLRDPNETPPRLALLGGGTMNVTAHWCGMTRTPGENFRRLMRAYRTDAVAWRESPVLAVTNGPRTSFGFTFALGPLVRLLERFERGRKSKLRAVGVGVRAIISAAVGAPSKHKALLNEMHAQIAVDSTELQFDRFATVMANVSGVVNPYVTPFVAARRHDMFNFLAYAVSSREFALMAPLLARGHLPLDPRLMLHPLSTWRLAFVSLLGKGHLPTDPRYVNTQSRAVSIIGTEAYYTLDGEIFAADTGRFDLALGPTLRLATLPLRA
jgi:diacylglycerol kinase family enzyme